MSLQQNTQQRVISKQRLTLFQLRMLGAVSKGEAKGVEIKRRLEDILDDEVFYARLYTNLDHLVSLGLLNKGEYDGRTNKYSITEAGKARLGAECDWFVTCMDGDRE